MAVLSGRSIREQLTAGRIVFDSSTSRASSRRRSMSTNVANMGSKYQGQRGPTPSRYWENFTT